MKKTTALFLGLALVLALAAAAVWRGSSYKTIHIWLDGQERTVTSSARTVGDLLRRENITLQPADRVAPALSEPLLPETGVQIERAVEIQILDGEQMYVLKSPERIPARWLAQAGIRLEQHDQLFLDGEAVAVNTALAAAPTYALYVRRAVQIHLEAGSDSTSFFSTAATLGQALEENRIELGAADQLEPPPETPLHAMSQPELTVQLRRGRLVTVAHPEGELSWRTTAATVGEALAEAGLSLQGLDYSEPSAEAGLPHAGVIRVVRVQENLLVEQEPIPFESELAPAPDLELDERMLLQNGEYGVQARRVRVRIENGEEVSRSVEAEWVARPPRSRIVGYGTKIVIRTIDTPEGPLEYWRAVRMYATSYSPCRIFRDRCDSSTALGAELKKGVLAMTNAWCRYTCGDRMYIPGYGTGTVLDTGGGIPGRYWIDLGYSDDDYVSWHHWVTVYFLTPVPDNYQVILP